MGGEYDQGENLYNSKCAMCHGFDGDGKGAAASSFQPTPSDFTRPGFWEKDASRLITDTIMHGRGMMPAFSLTAEEIKAIIDYMSHEFKK
jgi:mono/diheme cytochrome c family protein